MMKDVKYTISILSSKYIKNEKLQSIILNATSEFMQHNIYEKCLFFLRFTKDNIFIVLLNYCFFLMVR